MRTRKNLTELSSSELETLIDAMKCFKESGDWDEMVDEHKDHFTHLHNSHQQFLPWHRIYLLKFEENLRKYHSSIELPYWRWIGTRKIPDGFEKKFLGWMKVSRALTHDGDDLPTASDVSRVMASGDFEEFSDNLERIHDEVHIWVGGDMASTNSAKDPLFWFHHAYLDKLWERWRIAKGPIALLSWNLHDPYEDYSIGDVWSGVELGYQYSDMAY